MIHTIITSKGHKVHVAPDNEPIFNYSEIAAMVGTDPESAELMRLIKEVFSGAKVREIKHFNQEREGEQMAFIGFNAAEQQEEMREGFEVIPAADYKAVISNSEMVENSKKTGHFLRLEFTVIEGGYQGRKIFSNLNLDNPNIQTVDIARAELKTICIAVGKGNATIQDSSELHDLPLIIKVKVEKRKDNGEDSNQIKGYVPISGASYQSASKPVGNGTKTGAKPPWVK